MSEGSVSLVGAGPGTSDYLTLGAVKALQSAQALLYDALVDDEVLAFAPQRCVKICVGKRGGRLSVSQDKTNALMVRLAHKGLNVVRLKGGDPSVFGRVEEERQYLDAYGVAHRTIAGVTTASAAAAQFGFPLTHRASARSVHYLTGRTKDGLPDLDGKGLEGSETTLVFYMAAQKAKAIETALLALGRPESTPVLILENVGRTHAAMRRCSLRSLVSTVREAVYEGPVLICIGDVCAFARTHRPGHTQETMTAAEATAVCPHDTRLARTGRTRAAL
ncbi:uroporphyrinogen-III C-methyltransferase [Asticcacaulis currens]|jgi:uroporphyrin-III C-methyltransferase|uniref:uroporphyrinogen-III C-methyltransferase n=1 Tax=Asticcacaulis currens TaxID=2984210 RepID=A0ABT5IB30_9CAUL|nr:uroporphyrinogen-III C-methyltransferase [Asticcacaulis currens]MDC7693393.1 uroporphyrinogen-III C-methyltransferase [Asticcacaulis currens]